MTCPALRITAIVALASFPWTAVARADESAPQPAPMVESYPIALGGYCPVTIQDLRKWSKGDPRFGAIHRRRTFLFATADEQATFLRDPDRYTPVLTGYDPVRYLKTGEQVDGSPQFSLTYRRQVYLFTDEDSLKTFFDNPAKYAADIEEAARRER